MNNPGYASPPRLLAVAALTYRGQEDQPGRGDGGVVANAPGELHAVHPRHLPVENRQAVGLSLIHI